MDIMTTDDLCEELDISKQTAYLWRHKGTGPRGFKVGKYVRYRRSDVEAWIDEQIAKEVA